MDRFFRDFKKHYKYMVYAAKAELKAEISNTHLGWLWWILDPLLFMLVYAFMATVVFKAKEKYNFAYIFMGHTSWEFFNATVSHSVKLITSNSQIVNKVYIPKFVFVISKMGTNAFKMAVAYSIVLILMIGYRVPPSPTMLYFIPLEFLLFLLTFDVSMLMMHYGVFVEDLQSVVRVVLRLMFYFSGVFYSISRRIKDPVAQVILLKVNPVAMILADLRTTVLYGGHPQFVPYFIWLAIGLILFVVSVRLVYKYENSYVKVI